MASSLLTYTVYLPLGLGAMLALVLMTADQSKLVLVLIAAAMLLAIYVLLEGLPGLPPNGAKQKLVFVMAGDVVAVIAASRLHFNRGIITALALGASLVWLGWNKFVNAPDWQALAFLAVAVICAVSAIHKLSSRSHEPFLWPLAMLNFAIGCSLLALFGAFVGFAQVMGAFAAWAGGFLIMRYAFTLAGRGDDALPEPVIWLALLFFVSASFMVGLFAPGLNLTAYAVLALTLVVPLIMPKFERLSARIKPIAFALITAAPALVAVLVALWERGASAGA